MKKKFRVAYEKDHNDKKNEGMNISSPSKDPRNCDKCGYNTEGMYDLETNTF